MTTIDIMKYPVIAKCLDEHGKPQEYVINEEQVVYITEVGDNNAMLALSNGEKIVCISPPYDQWKNDAY